MSKRPFISSVRAEPRGAHTHVRVWLRGQSVGSLTVGAADLDELFVRLIPHGCERVDADCRSRWALAEATVQREGYRLTATQDDEDRGVARIAVNGEWTLNVGWDGERFHGWDMKPTPRPDENVAARAALEAAYAEAISHLPEPL